MKVLEFGRLKREPDVRKAKDMAEVILDKKWLKENKETDLYYMYRDLWKPGDKERIRNAGIRYDITIIPQGILGKEFVKTKGHYHPEVAPGISYPELYEVLEGKAHYLLQKKSANKRIERVVLIEAKACDKVLIPPNYSHITINPASKQLKMANLVAREFKSIYEEISNLKGAAYFELRDGSFKKNENYEEIPPLERANPSEIPDLGITRQKPIYDLIKKGNLEWLKKPQKFKKILSIY